MILLLVTRVPSFAVVCPSGAALGAVQGLSWLIILFLFKFIGNRARCVAADSLTLEIFAYFVFHNRSTSEIAVRSPSHFIRLRAHMCIVTLHESNHSVVITLHCS